MDSPSRGQEASNVAERTQKYLSLINKAREDEPASVIILLGKAGTGKSSFLEYLTGTYGHSMEAADSVTKKFQIEKTRISDKDYYIMDTPGFDYGSESEVFHEVVRGIEAVKPHAQIIGVLLVTSMNHNRVVKMDEKLLRLTRALGGDKYMTQVTVVTTFWEAPERDRNVYNTRLERYLETVKKLWSIQGPISHYQHGRKYQNGEDTGVVLKWDEDRNDIVRYARDMIHRCYGSNNLRGPRIVQELETGRRLEDTAAGQFLGLTAVSTLSSTSNPASSSSSAAPRLKEENAEKPRQDTPELEQSRSDLPNQDPLKGLLKEDPPQSSSSSDGASRQGTDPQTNKKGPWGYGLDLLGPIIRNIDFNDHLGAIIRNIDFNDLLGTVIRNIHARPNEGFPGGPPGPPLPHIPMGPRYNGPLDPNSVVDTFKARGWDSSFENRKHVGQLFGIQGTPGTAAYNDALRRKVQQLE